LRRLSNQFSRLAEGKERYLTRTYGRGGRGTKGRRFCGKKVQESEYDLDESFTSLRQFDAKIKSAAGQKRYGKFLRGGEGEK